MKLVAEKRTPGKADALRKQGRIPAVVYNNELNIPLSVDLRAFDRAFRQRGTSQVIELEIDGENHDVLVRTVQMQKRRREPIHVDFYAVTAGQTVDIGVQIDFIGTPIGAKEGGQIDIQRRDIQIRIIPRLIPERLEVDVSGLRIGDAIHMSDIVDQLPPQAEVLDELERTLITVLSPRAEEEEEVEELEPTEPEVIGQEAELEESGEDTAAE
ncbi:MAG: 50S ribosomal protein L25 [Trueperaceae bacterium]|nr:50S ribosomal protein L25 [Trueperaceae bacterium]